MSGRILPTEPGEWWAVLKVRPWIGAGPQVVTTYIEDGRPTFDGMDDAEPLEDQIEWLSPIPSPEVCAAVAEFIENGMGHALALGDAIRAASKAAE